MDTHNTKKNAYNEMDTTFPLSINFCPGTLADGYSTYSPICLRSLFGGKKVSHILPYDRPQENEEILQLFLDNRKRISISGVQEKLSLVLEKNKLRLSKEGEQGMYILKPIPRDLRKVDQVPANEHLTMQLARQVYRIRTAENAMIFFKDGTPAYITKRFDVRLNGSKWRKEDFASLSGKSIELSGINFKYEGNYEQIGLLIKKYVPAWRVEIEKYFSLVVFNYLFSNGDAHFKNFALLETAQGDFVLSPAYDLINSRMHVDDTDFALDHGLFNDGFKSDSFKSTGHAGKDDFIELAKRIEVTESRIDKILSPFLERQAKVELLIKNSFLSEPNKRGYLLMYNTKRNYLIA